MSEKGYGFIGYDESFGKKSDIFFHFSNLKEVRFEDLRQGDLVSFEEETGREGKKQAVNIKRTGAGSEIQEDMDAE